jgi:REP element-mobilizing transposase RayT
MADRRTIVNRYNPQLHHRRSIRLKGFDYSQAGAYFITVCTQDRVCCLADIRDGQAVLSAAGLIVAETWRSLPSRFAGIGTDAFIVMPNHVHGIVIVDGTSFNNGAPQGAMNRSPTLGECVRTFKAASTRLIRQRGLDGFGWQRNYHERVIRDDEELTRVREYIQANPVQWADDEENPFNDIGIRKQVR